MNLTISLLEMMEIIVFTERLGADTLQGGAGSDIYWVDDENDIIIETGNQILARSKRDAGAC